MHGSGDRGETFLPNRGRVRKSHPRIKALGDVDELNAFLGIARSVVKDQEMNELLKLVQDGVFHVGAYIAVANYSLNRLEEITMTLEHKLQSLEKSLPPLSRFIYPTGCFEASLLHVCRSVARRAERSLVELSETEHIDVVVLRFINRISKLLFAAARFLNMSSGVTEEEWNQV